MDNMIITEEILLTIYKKAEQVALAKHGGNEKPHSIRLTVEGNIEAECIHCRYGDWETETEYITADELNSDLDAIIEERLKEENRAAEMRKKEREEMERREQVRQKEERRRQFEQLKKEFGNG